MSPPDPHLVSTPLPDEIRGVIDELRAATERARLLYHDLGRGEALRRWKPESWSIAECTEHLNLTSLAFLPRLEAAVSDLGARGRARKTELRMDWTGHALRWMLEPPARLRLPTGAPFRPVEIGDPETAYERFVTLNGDLVKLVLTGAELALDEVHISSPFNRHVSYSVYSALRVLAAHERRHLWQAENVKTRVRAANA